ncbi:DUF1365 domain-containing protein [Tranquillimonas alkanivorans]|uniref:DUF1365 domain-containing protein n=1 Tax=Tranquillimonas alkanivorans TaxID=441119 RepID=A0A1I5PT37_9RHOB|nr:DUF1365 domain-containing protein [Tranquillimonas alkanivorans]SFP36806.1 hypothetical protein SAMN04488047_105225 [Tranquillimonas alkanivorans]
MSAAVEHLAGVTFHGRKGGIRNAFRYRVDYVCLDPEAQVRELRLFRRNAPGLTALHDIDHGGPPGQGRGAVWLREVLEEHGLAHVTDGQLLLIAQPRMLGHVFNPVSFWLVHDRAGGLRVVVAEVTNTFGDRHAYLCHRCDFGPITRHDTVVARKMFHVSPFQPVAGVYGFRFDIRPERIAIRIDYGTGEGGLVATLSGRRKPLTNHAVLSMCLRRPFGSRRVLALIHWQALKLWWKGARYRTRPEPPAHPFTRSSPTAAPEPVPHAAGLDAGPRVPEDAA